MYFYRKGKGRYKAAPEESLKAALASQERKRIQAEQMALCIAEMQAGRFPAAMADKLEMLLYAPDKSTLEFRGYPAFVAITFIRWWSQFALLHRAQAAAMDGREAKARVIEPGSPEWDRYYSAKNADMERQRRGSQGEDGRDKPGSIIVPP